ncbi:flavin reductase family protein [Sciscionella marina]|uniref:flavin reductase family protein n=1 Tax=Sciscionella marina TaxID=508770 RepID=UPI001F09F497|nr:flavin reductase family protein [Sciscionella marina]
MIFDGENCMNIPPLDETDLRRVYGTFPTGVVAVCAQRDGAPVGIAASSFIPVSLSPPLVAVCVQHTSTTWPLLQDRPRLGLSVLASAHEQVCRQIAAKTGDRFAGVDTVTSDGGAVLLAGALAWLECSLHEAVPAGDHDVALLHVEAARIHEDVDPLVFHGSRFHRLFRPSATASAQ